MMFKTHAALGFLLGLLAIATFNIANPLLFLAIVTFCSSLPDIDHPKSMIGRKFPFISWPISLVFNHRGFFHSIFPVAILFIVFLSLNQVFIAFAVALGYLAHLFGDAMTKEGVNFLHPFLTFRIQGPITTGQTMEYLVYVLLLIVNGFLTAKLFNII